jgi:hypothetical protein
MMVVLSIVALTVLLTLMVANLRARHGTRAGERQEASARALVGKSQHEESLRRRSEVRVASAQERDRAGGT